MTQFVEQLYQSVHEAIAQAEAILPGVPAPDGQRDPRWQAIIQVGEFIESDPDPVWNFVAKWGTHDCEDLRLAIATVLLEHLLEHHFDAIFPKVTALAHANPNFAWTTCAVWKHGQSERPENADRLDGLQAWCDTHSSPTATH
jgi:hypothetical protein